MGILANAAAVMAALSMGLAAAPVAAQTRALDAGVEWLPGSFAAGRQPDGNSVLIEAPDGWIVVDTGRHPPHVQAILARIRASGKALRAIVNTHWHLDHIGGNHALKAAFPQAQLIASDAIVEARSGFLAQYRRQLQAEISSESTPEVQRSAYRREIAVIDDTAASTPDVRVDGPVPMMLAGRGLSLGLERDAVTGGDVWVYDAAAQVLAAGDLVTLPAPLLDTACPERWMQAIGRISALHFRWLVPGHGEPMDRGQFEVYRGSYARLLRCSASSAPANACIDGWLADAGGLFPREQQPLARSLLAYYFEQKLRAPRAAACGR